MISAGRRDGIVLGAASVADRRGLDAQAWSSQNSSSASAVRFASWTWSLVEIDSDPRRVSEFGQRPRSKAWIRDLAAVAVFRHQINRLQLYA